VENQPITTVLQETHLAEPNRQGWSFICSSARLLSLLAKKWSKEFGEEVREYGRKDLAYEKTRREVKQEAALPNKEERMDRKARSI